MVRYGTLTWNSNVRCQVLDLDRIRLTSTFHGLLCISSLAAMLLSVNSFLRRYSVNANTRQRWLTMLSSWIFAYDLPVFTTAHPPPRYQEMLGISASRAFVRYLATQNLPSRSASSLIDIALRVHKVNRASQPETAHSKSFNQPGTLKSCPHCLFDTVTTSTCLPNPSS